MGAWVWGVSHDTTGRTDLDLPTGYWSLCTSLSPPSLPPTSTPFHPFQFSLLFQFRFMRIWRCGPTWGFQPCLEGKTRPLWHLLPKLPFPQKLWTLLGKKEIKRGSLIKKRKIYETGACRGSPPLSLEPSVFPRLCPGTARAELYFPEVALWSLF